MIQARASFLKVRLDFKNQVVMITGASNGVQPRLLRSEPKAAQSLIVTAEVVAQAVINVIENKRFEVVFAPLIWVFLSSLRS